jgi:DNA invertase Pin-like site-specific DNA recombinase
MSDEKITAQHRQRLAYVYIRQSTPKQVRDHRAGRENQYALVERALALGWRQDQIQIIDDDLGRSGQDGQRPGFQELVSAVSLGHAGLILAYDASRLARNNADWYTLLDLAALVGVLIGDTDGLFDPRQYNDRLLLGLRGMLSEAELHLLRLRMQAGRQRQIEQGIYRQLLPTGLVRLEDGRVVKDPDVQIQHAITLVFTRFATLGSCTKVLRSLCRDEVLLPRRQTGGLHAGQLLWKRPTTDAIYTILQNPAYAGAFVFGRQTVHPERRPGQRCRTIRRPLAEWAAIHHLVYPSYITWEQFMDNQQRLADNASNFARRLRGASREGAALLAGLVVCGHCGRQMRTAYKPKTRYLCAALAATHGQPSCLHLEGEPIETAVVAAFFTALAPAELDLLDEVLTAARADHEHLLRQQADQVTRAEYEVHLAQRQYLAVDPENRLVAAELEHRWEQALQTLAATREVADQVSRRIPPLLLDPALKARLQNVGTQLPALWESGQISTLHKKELLRSLIRRVILTRPVPDTVQVKLVWVSGAFSELTVRPPIQRAADMSDYDRLIGRLAELSAEGIDDALIADRLSAEGFHQARRGGITASWVGKLRRIHGFPSLRTQLRQQDQVEGQWTTAGLTKHLHIPRKWLYALMACGTLSATRHPLTGHFLIHADAAKLEQLQTAVLPALHPEWLAPLSVSSS